jgi:nicotinate-nucleotide adenylyltransferase
MRIGFLGGSFDPVHTAHLLIAESCLELAGLHEVRLLVAGRPPHKQGRRLAPPEHRLAMARLAVRGNPRLCVDERETRRSGPSFTIDSIREVLAEQAPGDRIAWIIGADSLPELVLWRSNEELLDLVDFITAVRPGVDVRTALGALLPALGAERVRRLSEGVVVMPRMEISSTDIRERIASGRSIRYLVPEAVAEYIRAHALYRD